MEKQNRYLVVDAGNTRVKIGVYEGDLLVESFAFSNKQLQELKSFLIEYRFHHAILCSVRSKKDTQWLLQLMQGAVLFNTLPRYPVQIAYDTPETLGADRLANVIAAHASCKGNALVIDIGTCVKFDFVDAAGVYQGGSISPGIELRYRSMHEFTGALPLINETGPVGHIGKSTRECMHIGVIQGIQAELDQFIQHYSTRFQGLTIFVTGGDAQHFDFAAKNDIFVNENLTLQGLLITIQAHAQ